MFGKADIARRLKLLEEKATAGSKYAHQVYVEVLTNGNTLGDHTDEIAELTKTVDYFGKAINELQTIVKDLLKSQTKPRLSIPVISPRSWGLRVGYIGEPRKDARFRPVQWQGTIIPRPKGARVYSLRTGEELVYVMLDGMQLPTNYKVRGCFAHRLTTLVPGA